MLILITLSLTLPQKYFTKQCWELLLKKVIYYYYSYLAKKVIYYYYKLLFNKSNILLLQITDICNTITFSITLLFWLLINVVLVWYCFSRL